MERAQSSSHWRSEDGWRKSCCSVHAMRHGAAEEGQADQGDSGAAGKGDVLAV